MGMVFHMALKPQTFGQALKLALSQAGMRQIDLASKSNMPLNTISKIAKDKHDPSPDEIQLLEKTIELEPGTLRAFAKKPAVKS